jgi:PAS domain S-box-containing protein
MAREPELPVDKVALLTAIVESSEDAIISTDLRTTLTSWNRAAEQLYGYTAVEAIGRPNSLIIPPDRSAEEADVIRRLLEGQSVPTLETIRVRKDGTRIDVALTPSTIRVADGRIIGISKISRDLSARRRDERQLRDLLERMSDAFSTLDREGRFTYVNERYVQMSGKRREELLGKIVWDVFPEATRIPVYEAMQKAGRDNVPVIHEGYYPPLDLWFETRIYPTSDGLASFTTDITERKRIERVKDETLQVSRRLATIVENSDDAIISKDLAGTITSWNPAAERMFGFAAGEAIGESIRIIVPKDRQDEETTILARLRQGEKIEHFETTRCRKDGTCFPISLTVSPIRDDSVVVGASKIARDISGRKRAEENAEREHRRTVFLAEMARRLSNSLDSTQILEGIAAAAVPELADWCAVDMVEEDKRIARVAVAPADEARIGLAKQIWPHDEDPAAPYSAPYVIRTATPVLIPDITDDMVVASAPGNRERLDLVRSFGLLSYLCVPLIVAGRAIGALILATAESDRRYTDDDLRFAEDIASRAALAVENARAYEEMQRANRLKDDFLATLSHELRTPLNAILGYARLARGRMISGDKLNRALDTIERNSTTLTQMVEDILDVSRISSGKMRLNVQPIDLPLILHEAVETMKPAADAKRIQLQTLVDPQVGPISGDPDRLRQIVWNLLSNAVKFTPKNGHVQLQLARINSSVEITVSDDGIGIAPDFLPHLFERFRQADSSIGRQHAGLGLGLAIVRNLVEAHGGGVTASSNGPGTGATFRVRLPVMIVYPATPPEKRIHPRQESALPVQQLPDLSGTHVLALDDEPDAVGLLAEILQTAGARVTTATSAAAALQTVETTTPTPDVIVADLGMPLMDGFEFIRRLRRSENRHVRDIPAAALTAYARSEDRARTLQGGFEMHLAKPIDPVELVSAVKALARRRDNAT